MTGFLPGNAGCRMFSRLAMLLVLCGFLMTLTACGGSIGPGIGMTDSRTGGAAARLRDAIIEKRQAAGEAKIIPPDMDRFARIYRWVAQDYVQPVDDEFLIAAAIEGIEGEYPDPRGVENRALVDAAIQGMLQSLDDYSTYLDRRAYRALREENRGIFGGLGVIIKKEPDGLRVLSPIDGSPAALAGIRPGDRITHADGLPLNELTLLEAITLLRGRIGTTVALRIRRAGAAPILMQVTRETIRIEPVKARLDGDVGYLRVSHFIENTGEALREEMEAVRDQAGKNLRGFVLDLRGNPGGILEEGVDVAGAFLSGGPVVSISGRDGEESWSADLSNPSSRFPVAVLIDEGSASASEIVAGALKDRNRAVLVGTESFGKGSVQSILPLSDGDAARMTTALYFTPSGRTVESGLVPDVVIPEDLDTDVDEQLRGAMNLVIDMAGGHSVYWNAGTVSP